MSHIFFITLISLLITFQHFFGVYADSDIFWHLRAGLDILDTKSLITADPYSFQTTGLTWTNHEWLAQVIFATFYKFFDQFGLLLIRSILLFSITFLLFAHTGISLSAILLLWFSSQLLSFFLLVQPALFSAFFFTYLLSIIWNKNVKPFYLWTIPFVFLLWANIHGGFILGLVFLTSALNRKDLRVIWLLSILCTFINPYGFYLYKYIFNELTSPHAHNGFWLPMNLNQISLPIVFLVLAIFSFSKNSLPRNEKIARFLFVTILFLSTIRSQRILPFFLLATLTFCSEFIKSERSELKFLKYGIVTSLVLISSLMAFDKFSIYRTNLNLSDQRYPVKAIEFIKAHYQSGNIALPFDWGGYVIYELTPNFKVSVDGRHIALYSERMMERNTLGVVNGDLNLFLEGIEPNFLLLNKDSVLVEEAKKSVSWSEVYQDSTAVVFTKP